MGTLTLHFGFFDREAMCRGVLVQREPSSRLRLVFLQLFGTLPDPPHGPPGFFSSHGVLSCLCPRSARESRPPVELILDLVRRTGCDVVYVSREARGFVEADRLADLLCPAEAEGDADDWWDDEGDDR